MIGMNVFYFVCGILFGAIMGYIMGIFNKCTCDCRRAKTYMKFVIMLFLAIALPFGSHYTRFEESKYIGIIFFGYFSYQVWGEEKPDKELASFWVLCQPFLFSSVGASIIIDSIQIDVFGKACLILVAGVAARWIGTFLVTGGDQGFTIKERMFFAFAWIPKATVQAAIGGLVLDTARNLKGISDEDRETYKEYGNVVLSMAVLSIIFTAPTGAILINTLGERWLSDDSIYMIEKA
jgi:NhaP-type Na+/H+ or K+/H+ antiporter